MGICRHPIFPLGPSMVCLSFIPCGWIVRLAHYHFLMTLSQILLSLLNRPSRAFRLHRFKNAEKHTRLTDMGSKQPPYIVILLVFFQDCCERFSIPRSMRISFFFFWRLSRSLSLQPSLFLFPGVNILRLLSLFCRPWRCLPS